MGDSSSCRSVDSQPYGVSFECLTCGRASANELPDPHFEIKEFAFRVAASSANLPLEEPLLLRALNMDGDPNSSVRSAPLQESHAALLSSRIRGSESLPPEEDKCSLTAPPGGWSSNRPQTGQIERPDARQRSRTICCVTPSMRRRNSFLSPRSE